jgi:predicted RNA-binding Zn-ribbon protein involved in translation (DUF1610 family)
MKVTQPESMDQLVYMTKRNVDGNSITAWVFRGNCPKCKKGVMGKPRDPKTGKVKIRAKEYVCPECEHIIEKVAYEESLSMHITYDCPHCSKSGECIVPFHRKKVRRLDEKKNKKVSVEVVRFQCEHCGKDIDISKKMK